MKMMRTTKRQFFGVACLLAGMFMSSCGKEETPATLCIPPQPAHSVLLARYFDNYKPGNFWIYATANGLQRDSLYVTQRSVGRQINPATCQVKDSTLITAYSGVLNLTGGLAVFKIGDGVNTPEGAIQSLVLTSQEGNPLLSLDAFDKYNQFRYPCKGCDLLPEQSAPVQLSAYRHHRLLAGKILDTAWQQFGTVIAPGLGMVQFVKGGTTDTFYLQRTNF